MKVIVHGDESEITVPLALKPRPGGGVTLYDKTPGLSACNILNVTEEGLISIIPSYGGKLQVDDSGHVKTRR